MRFTYLIYNITRINIFFAILKRDINNDINVIKKSDKI